MDEGTGFAEISDDLHSVTIGATYYKIEGTGPGMTITMEDQGGESFAGIKPDAPCLPGPVVEAIAKLRAAS